MSPAQVTTQPITTVRTRPAAGGDEPLRGGGGHHEQGEYQQRAGDLRRFGDCRAEQDQERDRQRADRDTPCRGDIGVHGGEQQRPADHREHRQHGERRRLRASHLAVGDAEEAAEKQGGDAVEESR